MEVLLTKGAVAIINDEDYEIVSKYKWCVTKHGNSFCAQTNVRIDGKRKTLRMHQLIMEAKGGQFVDHINGNGLDNRRENLRFCTNAQNQMNQRTTKNISGYKGVFWYPRYNKWISKICYNKKEYFLGYFTDKIEAAKAYDAKAEELFGEFACLNFKDMGKDEYRQPKKRKDSS
jgi:hypothetical protein